MRRINLISYFLLSLFVQNISAAAEKHDFTAELWAKGRSCLICHDLRNNLPKYFPPNSRIIDLKKLTPIEQAAYEKHPHNLSCLVCHQTDHVKIVPRKISDLDKLPPENFPPVITSGSEGTGHMRVISSGENMSDCLNCHDLHNKNSLKMLKVDYE